MLVLLPPSETKRDGGNGGALELGSLGFAELNDARTLVLDALSELATDSEAMMRALKLGPKRVGEVERNRTLRSSPATPAIDRYTGVLYDGLGADTLDAAARSWLERHVVVHSALFGLVRAGDRIPAYRLSHDSRLPDVRLTSVWADAVAGSLAATGEFVLDLRSESYVGLGAAPHASEYVRVVTKGSDGQHRALNHFNKKAKGELVAALARAGHDHDRVESLLAWAADAGWELARGAPAELELVVPERV